MQLKFKAKGDLLVSEPGAPHVENQAARYVGRKFVPPVTRRLSDGSIEVTKPGGYPAIKEPLCADSETKDGRRLMKLTRRDKCLWPADKATAAACCVAFVDTTFKDGEWVPAKKAPTNSGAGAPQE